MAGKSEQICTAFPLTTISAQKITRSFFKTFSWSKNWKSFLTNLTALKNIHHLAFLNFSRENLLAEKLVGSFFTSDINMNKIMKRINTSTRKTDKSSVFSCAYDVCLVISNWGITHWQERSFFLSTFVLMFISLVRKSFRNFSKTVSRFCKLLLARWWMLLKGFKLRKSYMARLEIVLQQKKWIQID